MMPPPVAIIAGGSARRMGGGIKGLKPLAGRPLLAHVIDRITPQCDQLALNSNDADPALTALGLPVLPDTLPDQPGPLAGILTAMTWAEAAGADHVITLPGDTPFLPGDFVPQLLLAAASAPGHPAIAQSDGRWHPIAGLWPVALKDDLDSTLNQGNRRVMEFAQNHGAVAVPFPAAPVDPFFNINTPEDLTQAETLFAQG